MEKHLSFISYLRVFAMLLVAFYHCFYCYVGWKNTNYSSPLDVNCWTIASNLSYIHVPLFLLIAGYVYAYNRFFLSKYSSLRLFIVKKSKRIIVPYIFWGGILVLVQNRSIVQFFDGIAHLWFLFVIFECYIVFRFLDFVFTNTKLNVIWLCLLLIYLFISDGNHVKNSIFSLDAFLHYFPYYMAGILCCNLKIIRLNKAISCVCLPIWGITWLICLKKGSFISPISLLLLISLLSCASHVCNKEKVIISSLDKYSMGIYIIHQPLLQELSLLPIVRDFRDVHFYTYPILAFVIIVLLSFLLSVGVKKTRLSFLLG